ncbi:gastrula zinc finger protein XlCGF8.2DB-like [Folsomia candida]|uniref:gastrula zinc finger protein XlCGF8.2DB-like n=1 Tax=Folsomia candida TaxID=158441 RepID=UPI00160538A2|nr:gastrula zinc finger protein XlCGF8.2DB-like [Folsomia candida]
MHARIHSADPRPFKCTECDQAFTQKVNLVRHEKTVHRKLKDFACLQCPKKFGRKGDMVEHLRSIHAKIRHPCPHCGHTFTQKGSLGRHLKKVHPHDRRRCQGVCTWLGKLMIQRAVDTEGSRLLLRLGRVLLHEVASARRVALQHIVLFKQVTDVKRL